MTWLVGADATWCERLCLTLLHALWQTAAAAGAVALLERVWRGLSLERRYALHVAALVLAVAALPVTFGLLAAEPRADSGQPSPTPSVEIGPGPVAPPAAQSAATEPAAEALARLTPAAPQTQLPAAAGPRRAAPAAAPAVNAFWERWRSWTPWIAGAYAAGVAAMLARLARAVLAVQRLAARARPVADGPLVTTLRALAAGWSLRVVPALAIVEQSIGPAFVGLWRPMILLPATAVSGLSPQELELILAHELAHMRRHDAWILCVQRLAEALLFFHPALWSLSRRISQLREDCCDELACQCAAPAAPVEQRRIDYARALLRAVELAGAPEASQTQLAARGRSPSELRRRVARLLGSPIPEPLWLPRGGLIALVLLTVALALGLPAWDGAAQQTEQPYSPVAEDGSFVFKLLVVGPDGAPLPQANVEIRTEAIPAAEQIVTGTFVRTHEYGTVALCDEAGVLRVRLNAAPQSYHFFVVQPGFGPYSASWNSYSHPDPVPAEFTAELDAGWTIGGIVVDEAGNPVEGVEVWPSIPFKQRPDDTGGPLHSGKHIQTDAQGAWRFESVPVSLETVTVRFTHADYARHWQDMPRGIAEVSPGGEPVARTVLPTGLEITGVVTDEAGSPLQGVLIRADTGRPDSTVASDAEGRYRLPHLRAGSLWLISAAPGRASAMRHVTVEPEMGPVDFTLQAGRTFRLRVTDEHGHGLAGVSVSPQDPERFVDYFDPNLPRQTTDEQGVWEWREAPVEAFQVSLYSAGRMQVKEEALVARAEEYVVTLPPELTIQGRVLDAQTKQPIASVRVIPGERGRPEFPHDDLWQLWDGHTAQDGEYRVVRTHGGTAHMLRFEADGYQSVISRDIAWDEGAVTLDIELTPATDVSLLVLTPDGQPAVGAGASVSEAGSQISFRNDDYEERLNSGPRIHADEQGKLQFPLPAGAFQLLVRHDAGLAYWESEKGPVPEELVLTPWARVEGTVRIGTQPASQTGVMLFSAGLALGGDDPGNVFVSYQATTDDQGDFVFERVPPGAGYVSRQIDVSGQYGGTLSSSSNAVRVEFLAGQTTHVAIGGTGRPVMAKLVPRPGYGGAVDWAQYMVRIEYGREPPPQPEPPEEMRNDRERVRAWYVDWMQTEEGQAWSVAYEQYSAQRDQSASAAAAVDHDGAFRLEDVPPGEYFLNVRSAVPRQDRADGPGILIHHYFTVPPMDEPLSTEPLDLGELTLQPFPTE